MGLFSPCTVCENCGDFEPSDADPDTCNVCGDVIDEHDE